jgi:hypothetical protein
MTSFVPLSATVISLTQIFACQRLSRGGVWFEILDAHRPRVDDIIVPTGSRLPERYGSLLCRREHTRVRLDFTHQTTSRYMQIEDPMHYG